MADNQHYHQQPRQEGQSQWHQQQPSLPSPSPFASFQPLSSSSFHSPHSPSSTSPPAIPFQSRPQHVQQPQQQQQLPHPYQPASPARPQVSSQQFTQAHSHTYQYQQQQPQRPPQPPFSHTRNNFAVPRHETSSPSDQPKFSHPLSVRDVHLESPQPHFATFERISTSLSDRPTSVASFSNLSSRSNEAFIHSRAPSSGESTPLVSDELLLNNQKQKQQPSPPGPRKQKKPFGRMNLSPPAKTYRPAHQQEQSSRSITPQPWHPDYDGNTLRHSRMELLDSPVKGGGHRRSSSRSSSDSGAHGGGRKNNNNNNEKNGQAPANGGLTKTRKGIFSRLRRARTFVEYDNRKTGRFAQFSNERLYLHWIRFGVLQGGIAVTLLSFGIGVASYVGVGALVLALTTLIYSTTLYHTRHLYMVTKRQDVLYYERVIPTMLALGLVVLYSANFGITVSLGDKATSPPPWLEYDVKF